MTTLDDITQRTPFIPSWHETGACMDRRHILWLREILRRTKVRRTLEIGVHTGASSSAFVDAGVPDAHFCDITPRTEALGVITGHGSFHAMRGVDALKMMEPFDLVFVDGNHALDAVKEEAEALLSNPPRIIVAHDINSSAVGFAQCEGAHYLWERLQAEFWFCIVDAKDRPGEMTKRGMLVASKDREALPHILEAYRSII